MSSTSTDRVKLGHRAFRAVLEALSYPGRRIALPGGASDPAGAIVEAIWGDDPARSSLICCEGSPQASILAAAHAGSEAFPEAGATVLCRGPFEPITRVLLDGPGLREPSVCDLPLSPEALAVRNDRCSAPPLGIDVIFVWEDGTVVALPRTTAAAPA